MKKKILGVVIAIVLAAFLFVAGSALILFLAPGSEIFGIRYVALGDSKYSVKENIADFAGQNIYINTHGVPINIEFTEYYASNVEFSQNFVGFTKSDFDKPDVNVYTDDDGNLHIETKELVKWLYAYETEKNFALNIKLSAVKNEGKNLHINSEDSSLEIVGAVNLNNFSMVSEGDLVVKEGNSIRATNFKYHTNKQINITEKIIAENFDLYSSGSSINVQYAHLGVAQTGSYVEVKGLKAETKSGDIRFVSCYNLKAKSSSGNIRAYGDGLNSVKNNVNVETNSGNIILGNINLVDGDTECNINTLSGDVSITTLKDGNIVCERGDVNIDQANNLVITGKVGKITVQSVLGNIVVNGRNGNVSLGASGTLNNVKVTTTTGKIDVKNVCANGQGTVDLKSESNTVNIKVVRKNMITESEKQAGDYKTIKIVAGRAVTATGLEGKVSIDANGDVDVSFKEVYDDVLVKTGTKTDNINISVEETPSIDVDYDIESSKGTKAEVYVGDEKANEGSKIKTDRAEGTKKSLITVKTSYAKATLKFKTI